MLELHDLTAAHDDTQVLHGLSLRVAPGTIHAVLGRNGAGKTTMLRRVMGLLAPHSGRIILDGIDISTWNTPDIARTGIGYVPEGREVFTSLSVRENLTLAGRIGTGTWTVAQITALFRNLSARLETPAAALSGGEQQMLAIGRALMTSPKLLLLDEPTEGLSAQIISLLHGTLQTLKANGMTIILAEQNIRFTIALADQITLVSRGQDIWHGPITAFEAAGEIRSRYLGA